MLNKQSVLVLSGLMLASNSSLGITILAGPSFTPATNAPLAGLLQLTSDVATRVSVSVDEGTNSWTRCFYDFGRTHAIPLAGFKPGRTNQILVTIHDQAQASYTAPRSLTFISPRLPADFPHSIVLQSEPSRMELGYTLFTIQNRTAKTGYITMMNNDGEVVWYMPVPAIADVDVRQLGNGDLFVEEPAPLNRFLELNLLGDTVQTWSAPAQYPVNNHEGLPTDHGTILYLSDMSRAVTNFPSNATNSAAPLIVTNVDDNPVVEISATNGALLNAWAPIDMLNPTRVTYLTYQYPTSFGVDNEHANAIIEDPKDDSLIVSLRAQNAVFKFTRATGQLKWILGPPANWGVRFQPYLLNPVGSPFAWNYGQHAPELTPRGTLLLYDDGNARACPYDPPVADQDNYSRAVEYSIDETNMQVAQVWDTTAAAGDRLYTFAVGDADWLPQTSNLLVTYGLISYVNGVHPNAAAPNATMVRIREYTHDTVPQVVFDLSFFDSDNTNRAYLGYLCYRSDRVADLYAHPARAVGDLNVQFGAQGALLTFTADPARTYTLDASSDGSHWTPIGTATVVQQPDGFAFLDATARSSPGRFYRVITR